MLLLVLLLLTKREKRRSWIFFMNGICLSLNIVRSVLQCLWLTGSFWNVYSQLAYDTSRDSWRDRANTIASNTMTLLLVICIMVSLSMQVWVVSITTPMIQRILVIGTTSVLALISIGYRLAVTVISNISTMESSDISSKRGIVTVMYIFQAITIWGYCTIFTFKLGYAIIQRRRIGMTQFGPMQIIFIMGAQTMVIPGMLFIFFASSYTDDTQLSSAFFNSTTTSRNSLPRPSPSSASSFHSPPSGPVLLAATTGLLQKAPMHITAFYKVNSVAHPFAVLPTVARARIRTALQEVPSKTPRAQRTTTKRAPLLSFTLITSGAWRRARSPMRMTESSVVDHILALQLKLVLRNVTPFDDEIWTTSLQDLNFDRVFQSRHPR